MIKKFALVAAMLAMAASCVGCGQVVSSPGQTSVSGSGDQAIARAFKDRQSGIQVEGQGVVTKVLSDDNEGSRHQRFILRLSSGQTLLFAHNIDIAPRLPSLRVGDSVAFFGIYEYNAQGGLVHWTHRDPSGQHPTGWLKYKGQTFQ